ncbi:hypothetical protein SISNIDRAFT_453572 [Sistotremastrum niveocremeum HHB9708]|uniref:RNA polymerase II-associated n=1 Tax=Sistotremastrum niveocremeum HHB9708 TaxID=1314777 RepID=A0A164VZQ6_9AGAM|nr:hypothetical protein SISNIDRAFT_453572 [Sistotremastrum niveocremeum HHB9708]
MSVKKSKLDLLVRVRYTNPLPPPPCPPKLLNIPTNPQRFTKLDFTNALANETPLPMIVDAECGMPLDLAHFPSLWMENGDHTDICPDINNLPTLDPKDAWLASETAPPPSSYANSSSSYTPAKATSTTTYVPWLRRTEYISREASHRSSSNMDAKQEAPIDVSLPAQIATIEASFPPSAEPFDLSKVKYPGKPHLKPVESWDILPDAEIWANSYDLFKFSERPGDRPLDEIDPRLNCSILRPTFSEGDHYLAYYLVKDDEDVANLASQRAAEVTAPLDEPTVFHFVRDYDTVKIEQDVSNEFLLVMDDGDNAIKSTRRKRGAYYKSIERKINLKKKRVMGNSERWDAIKLTHRPFESEEIKEREETLLEVTDPHYLIRVEQDAEGEVETEDIKVDVKSPHRVEV